MPSILAIGLATVTCVGSFIVLPSVSSPSSPRSEVGRPASVCPVEVTVRLIPPAETPAELKV